MELIGTFFLILFFYFIIRFILRIYAIRRMFFGQKRNENHNERSSQADKTPSPGEKLELDELEKRKFDKDQGEYVDFEDIKDR